MADAFAAFGGGGDGVITASELRDFMNGQGSETSDSDSGNGETSGSESVDQMSDEEIERTVADADADGDGQVSQEEFPSMMTSVGV